MGGPVFPRGRLSSLSPGKEAEEEVANFFSFPFPFFYRFEDAAAIADRVPSPGKEAEEEVGVQRLRRLILGFVKVSSYYYICVCILLYS